MRHGQSMNRQCARRASDAYGGRFQGKCSILQTWVSGYSASFSAKSANVFSLSRLQIDSSARSAFFKLGFLDPTAVSLGMRFSEMLPTLWLKTGAKGKCPELNGEQVPDMLILPKNQFAVLINENTFADFAEKLAEYPETQV